MSAIRKYIKENVFGRCGQAVSRLAASELIPRPEMPTSEQEVHEWWLVSPELAAKLRAERCPVLQFCELHMWGREATGTALEDDEELLAAIGPAPARRTPARRRARPRRATHRRR
jgi:hypothetical protein